MMPTSKYDRHDILCTVLWVPSRVIRTVQCFQLLQSRLVILYLKDWFVDVVEDHFEVFGWGWFSIFWIKFRTLTPCDRFTAECGTLGMLKSMFTSSITRLKHVVRVKRCNVTIFFKNKLFFHCVCTWAVLLNKLPCSIVSMLNANVFRQFLRFLRSIWCKEYISSYRKSQQKWLRELYNIYTNFIMTNEDNNHDTKYTNKNDTNNHDARDLHEWAQQRAV